MSISLPTLLEALPACKRCRKNRRRCDTKLPSCANCSKAGVECIFYDHALQEELPRSYIASLVDHLEQTEDDILREGTLDRPTHTEGGHHFAYAQGAYRYLGAGSHLLDVHLCERDKPRPHPRPRPRPCLPPPSNNNLSPDLRAYLTQLFFDTIHHVYPILDPSSPWLVDGDSLSPTHAFLQEMVCAVACHCESDPQRSSLAPVAAAAYARALRHIEQATAAQAVSTLQVVVLLLLYTLVQPATGGNISQQLGFAIRLVIDLCESPSEGEEEGAGGEAQAADKADKADKTPPLASLYKVIYCLENHVCGVLVRPTALPEPSEALVVPSPASLSSSSSCSPLDLLSTLYRVQARCRSGRLANHDALRTSIPALAGAVQEASLRLHPNIVAVLGETCLVLDPSSVDAAVLLLDACSDAAFLATFASAYWVHRAGEVVVATLRGKGSDRRLVRAYGQATALLQAWSGTWEAAGVLRQALEQAVESGS